MIARAVFAALRSPSATSPCRGFLPSETLTGPSVRFARTFRSSPSERQRTTRSAASHHPRQTRHECLAETSEVQRHQDPRRRVWFDASWHGTAGGLQRALCAGSAGERFDSRAGRWRPGHRERAHGVLASIAGASGHRVPWVGCDPTAAALEDRRRAGSHPRPSDAAHGFRSVDTPSCLPSGRNALPELDRHPEDERVEKEQPSGAL